MTVTTSSGTASNVILTVTYGGWQDPPEAAVPAWRPRLPDGPPVLAAAKMPDGTWAVAAA